MPGTKDSFLLPHLGHFNFSASCSEMVQASSRISRNDIGRLAWLKTCNEGVSMCRILRPEVDAERPIEIGAAALR